MKPYFDFGSFTLLLVNAPGSPLAWELTRRFSPPHEINHLHALQIQNLFMRGHREGNSQQRAIARAGFGRWRRHLTEAVFEAHDADFNMALRVAVKLNSAAVSPVPSPSLLLHPALAATEHATHFLSFDPRSRALARALRLQLLPEPL